MSQANTPAAAEQLRDIHLPADVSWFPPAIGWWIVLLLVLLSMWALRRIYNRYRYRANKPVARSNWRPALQSELAEIQQQFSNSGDAQQLAIDLSQLLRKTVIHDAPHKAAQIAGLTGSAWLAALDQHFGTDEQFSLSAKALTEAPYNPKLAFDADSLLSLAEQALANPYREAEHA